ncbi:uncharacterized protein G6M90_00g092640 [Metarhizium brunneum]|uniref:RNase H type-1 domain-containing protein n=1 Tax=Metarhizium brunneum TaxID=500148 RepID=A0A7D5V0Z5_9HYPO|nr:hypothetical protein G6M90_00g092640 [Metarhizium brunneum]
MVDRSENAHPRKRRGGTRQTQDSIDSEPNAILIYTDGGSFNGREGTAVVCTANQTQKAYTSAIKEPGHVWDIHTLLDYAAKAWGTHFREADIVVSPRLCDPDDKSHSVRSRIDSSATGMKLP